MRMGPGYILETFLMNAQLTLLDYGYTFMCVLAPGRI